MLVFAKKNFVQGCKVLLIEEKSPEIDYICMISFLAKYLSITFKGRVNNFPSDVAREILATSYH